MPVFISVLKKQVSNLRVDNTSLFNIRMIAFHPRSKKVMEYMFEYKLWYYGNTVSSEFQ